MEIWKQIEKFPDYEVSNLGRVKSFKRYKNGKILNPYKNNEGYHIIDLSNKNEIISKKVHILLYETFNNYKLKDNECVHHKDEDKGNNVINNLEKMIKSEHHSLHNKGKIFSESHKNKLSRSKIGHKNPRGMLGKKHSEKSINLMKINHIDVKGKNNQNSKLEEWMVKSIYQISNSPIIKQLKITQQEIGDIFNISKETVYRIKNKKSWNHITGDL